MKNLKVRISALAIGALVAGSTVIGAVAMQGDSSAAPAEVPPVYMGAFPVLDSEPIVYSGSYGLFPSK